MEPKRRNISQRSELVYDVQNFGINTDTREIFLNSPLDENSEYALIDHRTANNFIKNLRLLNTINHNSVLIHMTTCGGIQEYGMAIYDAIKFSESETILVTYAHARSMSSIIPQAATIRIITPNSYFLIHYGTWSNEERNYSSIISDLEWTKKQTEEMLDIYVNRCYKGRFWKKNQMSKNGVRKWLVENLAHKQELYLSAQDCVDKGFMDGILGSRKFPDLSSLRC